MKVLLQNIPSAPLKEDSLQAAYEPTAREIEIEEALALVYSLTSNRDLICLEESDCGIEFWKREESIWVEITGTKFWATSEVNEAEAKAIIEMLDRGENFGNCIPTTNREWDAYGHIQSAAMLI